MRTVRLLVALVAAVQVSSAAAQNVAPATPSTHCLRTLSTSCCTAILLLSGGGTCV